MRAAWQRVFTVNLGELSAGLLLEYVFVSSIASTTLSAFIYYRFSAGLSLYGYDYEYVLLPAQVVREGAVRADFVPDLLGEDGGRPADDATRAFARLAPVPRAHRNHLQPRERRGDRRAARRPEARSRQVAADDDD